MDYSAFVKGKKTILIAPAGYGKTYSIVECLKYTEGRQLILTHTHAGVAAIKNKIKESAIESYKYHIETISSYAQKYVNAFYIGDDVPAQEGREYFTFVIEKACDLFCIDQVKRVVKATYSGLFVDEYQDCSKTQHKMIMLLSSVLPTHILGDPMQGIFDFNGEIVDFDSDIEGFEISRLDTPYRWYNSRSNDLGDALNRIRLILEKKQSIDLNNFSKINGLNIHNIPSENIWQPRGEYRNKLTSLISNSESLLILVPNTYRKSNIDSRKKLKSQIDYTQSLALIEAIDDKDLYKVAKNIDEIIDTSASNINQIKDKVLSPLFNSSSINEWFNNNGLKTKRDSAEKDKSNAMKRDLDNFITSPSSLAMLAIIRNLKGKFNFRYGREELLRGVIKALETANYENITVYDGMRQHRNTIRRVGRKIFGKCLGTTLLTKGLEFDTVAILDAHEFDCPKHLYVALTRCCKNLIIFTDTMILFPYRMG